MRKAVYLTLSSLCVLGIAACETAPADPVKITPPASSHHKLAGTSWSWDAGLDKNPMIEFKANGHLGGFTGCNQIGGVFEESSDIKDGRHMFKMSEVFSTEMACAQGMKEEQAFINAITKTETFSLSRSDFIVFYDDTGQELVRLTKIP